jgi:hypothetical protein
MKVFVISTFVILALSLCITEVRSDGESVTYYTAGGVEYARSINDCVNCNVPGLASRERTAYCPDGMYAYGEQVCDESGGIKEVASGWKTNDVGVKIGWRCKWTNYAWSSERFDFSAELTCY